MFSDPIAVTRNAVAQNLGRVNQDNFSSIYLKDTATESFVVNIRHQDETAKAGAVPLKRHNLEFVHTTLATPTSFQKKEIVSVTIRHQKGDDPNEALLTAKAVLAFLTDANLTRIIAGEP